MLPIHATSFMSIYGKDVEANVEQTVSVVTQTRNKIAREKRKPQLKSEYIYLDVKLKVGNWV